MTPNQNKTKKSFRDPSGYLIEKNNKILRFLTGENTHQTFQLWEKSSAIANWIKKKSLISFEKIEEKENEIVLEHPFIEFPSYPYEWSPSMLSDAGHLTVKLAQDLLKEGLGIKDASPYNVLFQGPHPIFIDLASIEKRDPLDPIWLPYGQFMRMFLLPLYLNRKTDVLLSEIFLTKQDGIDPSSCVKRVKKTSPLAYSLVFIPHLLSLLSSSKTFNSHRIKNPDLSKFILQRIYKKADRILTKLKSPKNIQSHWASYMDKNLNYSNKSFQYKYDWIKTHLQNLKPQKILDVGCNTGHFSILAAECGSKVVAIDYDPAVIDKLYLKAQKENLNILPLVVNLSFPSPSIGWENKETHSFLERSHEHFDMVLMLAVIHHMLITNRIPMEEIASRAAQLTKKWLIVEFIDQEALMFKSLTLGRDSLYKHITFEFFKNVFKNHFKIETISDSSYHPTRTLVLLKKENSNVS